MVAAPGQRISTNAQENVDVLVCSGEKKKKGKWLEILCGVTVDTIEVCHIAQNSNGSRCAMKVIAIPIS